jgi:hypothetical protein
MTPNNQFQRSVNSRLRRLSPPAELGRWAAFNSQPPALRDARLAANLLCGLMQ